MLASRSWLLPVPVCFCVVVVVFFVFVFVVLAAAPLGAVAAARDRLIDHRLESQIRGIDEPGEGRAERDVALFLTRLRSDDLSQRTGDDLRADDRAALELIEGGAIVGSEIVA